MIKMFESGTILETVHIWLPNVDVLRKHALNLCLMSSGYQMISYSLNLPKGNLSFILNLRVNHHRIEFVISGVCTSVMSLSYLVLDFWGYLSYAFNYIFNVWTCYTASNGRFSVCWFNTCSFQYLPFSPQIFGDDNFQLELCFTPPSFSDRTSLWHKFQKLAKLIVSGGS